MRTSHQNLQFPIKSIPPERINIVQKPTPRKLKNDRDCDEGMDFPHDAMHVHHTAEDETLGKR